MSRLIVLAAALATLRAGGAATQVPTSVARGDAVVVGRVIDRDSKRPLADVLVELSSADLKRQLLAQTNADGRYAFEDLAAGEYRLTAKHDGYIDQAHGVPDAQMGRISPEAVIAVAAHAQVQIDFALVRMGVISGRVAAPDGKPLTNAVATLTMLTDRGIAVSGRWVAKANDRGEYTITKVPEGVYQVSASWTDEVAPPGLNLRRRQIYHPGTEWSEQATAITVAAGQTIKNVDIVMPATELLRLAGKVVRSGDAGTVEAYLLSGSSVQSVRVKDEDGSFSTPRLTAGRYTLVARTNDAEAFEAAWLTVDLTVELNDLVLGLSPTGIIAGRVVSDDGSPVPQTLQVAAVLADQGKEIDLLMRDRVDLGSEGTFELSGVFGERVLRIVGRTEGWAIDRVMHGKTPVSSLTIAPGVRVDDVRIIVTRKPS